MIPRPERRPPDIQILPSRAARWWLVPLDDAMVSPLLAQNLERLIENTISCDV